MATTKKTLAQLDREWLESDVARLVAEREWLVEETKQKRWENGLIEGSPTRGGNFLLLGVVEEESVYALMRNINTWATLHPGEGITLAIDTPGGDVTAGLSFIDFLRRLSARGHEITTVAQGLVASMGAIIMQAGDRRLITPHGWLMVHGVSGGAMGTAGQLRNVAAFNERLQDQALDLLAARSNLSRNTLKKKWADDWWVDAAEAVKTGLVDAIEE